MFCCWANTADLGVASLTMTKFQSYHRLIGVGWLRNSVVELNKVIRLDRQRLAVWRERKFCFTLRGQLDLGDARPCCGVVDVHTPRSNMIADIEPTNSSRRDVEHDSSTPPILRNSHSTVSGH